MITSGNSPKQTGGANAAPQTQTNMGNTQSTMNTENTNTAKAGFSFLRQNSLVDVPMARTAAAEFLTKLLKTGNEVLEDNLREDMDVRLIPLDAANNDSRIQLSALSVAVRFKDQQYADKFGVGYINLLLEGSVEKVAPVVQTVDSQQIEIIKTAGQADTAILREATKRNVAISFGLRDGSKVIEALSCAVPRDFNVEDKKQVRALLTNATAAAATEMQRRNADFVDLNLASAANDATLTIQTDYHQPSIVDSTGQPVRSDIVVRMTAEPVGDNKGEDAQRPKLLAITRAFVNMLYAPQNQQQQQAFMPGMMMPNTAQNPYQHYAAQVVLTGMEAMFSLTPAAQCMALWSAMSIRDNGGWFAAFENRSFEGKNTLKYNKDIDLKDIGAIGYEVNMTPNDPDAKPGLIPTKTANFTRQHLMGLLMTTFAKGALLSLDVPDSGESTWYNGVFAAAAAGVAEANKTVLQSVNQLTNGEFQHVWPANGEIFDSLLNRNGNNRIHFGYFTIDGVKYDIREIDYLAVLNWAGARQANLLLEWSETFNRANMDPAVRLYTRLKIIRMMFPDVVITGTGYRLTFSRQFLDCLAAAAGKTGLRVTNVAPMYDTSTAQRTGLDFSGALLDPNGTSSFNRGGYSNVPGGNAGHNPYTGRWQ